jgi:hypothetical protein
MSEEVIRTTSGCNEAMMGSLLGSMANRNNNDPMAMAAMMNNSQWMNNPFIYLVFLMMFGRNGLWGNNENGLQDSEIQAKLNQLSTQMQDGNNTNLLMDAVKGNNSALQTLSANLNCDFNQLQSAVNNVQSAIQQVGGAVGYSAEKVINAANLGDMNIVQQLKDCCCQTQQNIIKMGYDNQLGQKDIQNAMQQGFSYTNTGLERGFSNIGYTLAQGFCDIKNAGTANTQRIVDVLNNHWQEDLQLRLNRAEMELSQQRQNATLIAALKTTSTTTTATT